MSEFHESRLLALIGAVDGVNRTFNTSSKFIGGTVRVVWNGQVYEPDDVLKGWTELDDETIQTTIAPQTGDVLQAYYRDLEPAYAISLDQVRGSPFDPNGVLP